MITPETVPCDAGCDDGITPDGFVCAYCLGWGRMWLVDLTPVPHNTPDRQS